MRHFDPVELTVPEVFGLLTSGVAPRPIALVATLSENGEPNLAPFSFFNAFGSNPPMVAFSPSSRARDGSRKDTYYNIVRENECTIQVVTYDMVEQVNLASTEYDTGVNEFTKSGLTPIPSDIIKAPRVKESPFQMECVLEKEVSLGTGKGAGNLMICKVIRFHVAEEVFNENGIDPHRIDLVARMGDHFYTKASGESIFQLEKPSRIKGMGYDKLPEYVKLSHVFTANNLAQLAGAEHLPLPEEAEALLEEIRKEITFDHEADLLQVYQYHQRQKDYRKMLSTALELQKRDHLLAEQKIQLAAQAALEQKDRDFAWKAIHAVAPFSFPRTG